jgi:mono/diheme cytochrome c family protein
METIANRGGVMKKMFVCVMGFMFLIVLFMPAHGVAQTKEVQKSDPKDLFEKKCSVCHKSDRAISKKKTQKDWDTTVMRMINSRGAQINDAEAKIIIDYLAANYGKGEKK